MLVRFVPSLSDRGSRAQGEETALVLRGPNRWWVQIKSEIKVEVEGGLQCKNLIRGLEHRIAQVSAGCQGGTPAESKRKNREKYKGQRERIALSLSLYTDVSKEGVKITTKKENPAPPVEEKSLKETSYRRWEGKTMRRTKVSTQC